MNWDHLDDLRWRLQRLAARSCSCCLCCCFVVVILILVIGGAIFFSVYSPEVPSATVEIGENVPVLLDSAGFDPFWFDQVQVTLANLSRSTINITLFSGFCEKLFTNRTTLPPRKFSSLNASDESRLPFNYYGGDTPVYNSAGGKGSFIRINTSAEAEGSFPCGVRLFRFSNITSYVNFLNKESKSLPYNITQQDTQCIPVGPPSSPLTSSVTFYLNEPGFYWQAMIVNSSVLMNSTVSGIVSFYNTSSLGSVFCNFTHTIHCSIRISMLPSTPNQHVCVLALSDTLSTVKVKAVRSMWNIGTVITASAVLMLSVLLCCCCCCCCCRYVYMNRLNRRRHRCNGLEGNPVSIW